MTAEPASLRERTETARPYPPFPAVADVLPHAGRMLLLTRVVDHDEDRTTCLVALAEDSPFCGPDRLVPAWVGLEYMAQCVAAHAGLQARARGEPIRIGLLLGSRRIEIRTAAFAVGQALEVHARRLWAGRELGSFACRVVDRASGTLLVEGTLSVFLALDIGMLAQGFVG
jgi:predicted hotdog family 3-hydroxylacyl-ACP dehydratase